MSNKYTSVYDWLKYIKANVVGINLRELRLNSGPSEPFPAADGAAKGYTFPQSTRTRNRSHFMTQVSYNKDNNSSSPF